MVRSIAPLRGADAAPGVDVLPTLLTARVRGVRDDEVELDVAGRVLIARRDPSVHPVVLAGSAERQERVLVERDAEGRLAVIGALRTQPTPGIDKSDVYSIEAERISLKASSEISIAARAAGIALRAAGEVETVAERIISRAEGVHKIVGRMLRLN